MRHRTTRTTASAGKDITSRSGSLSVSARTPPSPNIPSDERLLHKTYRELTRKHLRNLFKEVFTEFTGLHFHIAWEPSASSRRDGRTLPVGCSVCCRLSGSPRLKECRICGPRRLAHTLSSLGEGHRFICRFGVRNYWLPIRVRGEILGIAYLQALEHPVVGTSGRSESPYFQRANATVMSRLRFIGAARFLRLIVQHVQTATLADLRKADLTNAGRALLALEREQARLHEVLQGHLPAGPQALRRCRPESQTEQIVHRLAERLESDYGKPVTLQQYAREMGMNTAYLSALFSRVVGIPFKAYLTDLRLEKAKALLGDPTRTASEVASAVGYASENRFRSAFKQATSLSPKCWRQTMQTVVPQAS